MRATLAVVLIFLALPASAADWPAWRGPEGMGHSAERGLPLTWSPTENVRWKTPLPAAGNSTPIISRDRIFLTQATENGKKRSLWCLDRVDGKVLWTCQGLGRLVYTSPLACPNAIVAMSGFIDVCTANEPRPTNGRPEYRAKRLTGRVIFQANINNGPYLALRPGGSGDVTETHRLWRVTSAPQRVGSGVIVGQHLYMVNEPGTFQCIDLKTGAALCTERVSGGVWGSLVHADGRLHVTTLDGETLVLSPKPTREVLARNPLKERTLASIAVSEGEIFIRTYQHLWCIQSPRRTD